MVISPDFEDTMVKYGVHFRLLRLNGQIKTFSRDPKSKDGVTEEKECDPKQLPNELWKQYEVLTQGGVPARRS